MLVGLLLFGVCFASSLSLDVSFHVICLELAVASLSLQPLTIAHCFNTLGSDRFDGLLRCYFVVVFLLFGVCFTTFLC